MLFEKYINKDFPIINHISQNYLKFLTISSYEIKAIEWQLSKNVGSEYFNHDIIFVSKIRIDRNRNKNRTQRNIAIFYICHWVIIHQTLIRLYTWRWQLLVQYCAAFELSFFKFTHVTSLLLHDKKYLLWTNTKFSGQFSPCNISKT